MRRPRHDNSAMQYQTVIGIDEAGLGPLLGPLTIGYSAFRLPRPIGADGLFSLNMWRELGLSKNPAQRKKRPVVCDSKKLYSPAKGIAALEEETLSWAHLAGHACENFASFRAGLCPLARERAESYDWYVKPPQFPLEASIERASLRAASLRRKLEDAGYALEALGVSPVLEGELNGLMKQVGNKARAEFEVIARILAPLWQRYRHVAVLCDRQGGRARYGRALSNQFPEAQVNALHEAKEISSYELSIPEVEGCPRMFIAFIEKGDGNHLPIALASMAAKYVRELMMSQFNAWFHTYDAGIKPTAGYYGDGQRWLNDTSELRQKLGVRDERLIRAR
jgi:ribonuclease HII